MVKNRHQPFFTFREHQKDFHTFLFLEEFSALSFHLYEHFETVHFET